MRTLRPLAPIGTAVLSTRPSFTWDAMAGATSYSVAVYDERFNEIARGDRLAATAWVPPLDLERGRTYLWQVTAHRASGDVTAPAPPQPEARFTVLAAETAAVVTQQQVRLGDRPLELGIVLAQAGLLGEARVQLELAAAGAASEADRAAARALLAGNWKSHGAPASLRGLRAPGGRCGLCG